MFFKETASQKYFLYAGNTDMRKGFDSLCGVVTTQMQLDALNKDVYIFINRRHTQIKILRWEGDGFSLYYKRLEKGTYTLPATETNQWDILLSLQQLQMMFEGVSMKRRYRCKRYQHTSNIVDNGLR